MDIHGNAQHNAKTRDIGRIASYVVESSFRLGIAAIIGVFVARHLGPTRLGLLSFSTAVFSVAVVVGSLGMRPVLITDLSTQDDWAPSLASALARQIPAATLASVLAASIVVLSRGNSYEALFIALVLLPLPILALHDTARAALEAKLKIARIVVASLTTAVIVACLRVAGILADLGTPAFAAVVTIEAAVLGILLAKDYLHPRKARLFMMSRAAAYSRDLVTRSWPLLISALAVTIYMRVDLVMLGLMKGDTETGLYSAAARFSEFWYFIPVAVAAALRPRLAKLFASGHDFAYRTVTQRFITGSFWTSIVVVILVLSSAEVVVTYLFGADFDPAVGILRIHITAAPFVFLSLSANQWFIDRGQTRLIMSRSVVGAAINVIGNLILIPLFGGEGAALATVISYAIAGVLLNGIPSSTRPIFVMQARALLFALK